MTLELKLSNLGYSCWLDQNAARITKEAMKTGVEASRIFLLFLSEGVLTRPFCLFEIKTAMGIKKPIMLMHETDSRHGAFDFAEAEAAPPAITELTLTHESLPWRRRRFEQDAILQELVKNSGLEPAPTGGGVASGQAREGSNVITATATTAGGGGGGETADHGLAPVPSTVPQLPESYSPRPNDNAKVLDVLLGASPAVAEKSKVLAHGMGGLGKTTMAASVVRNEVVRKHYSRIGFVSAGQVPATMEEQRALHYQLTREHLEPKPDATVASQRELLQSASAGCKWLVVLDDLWTAEHEHQLNFVDSATAPDSKVFATTRFAKLLPGYVEVALGLLSEAEAVTLLLVTAEMDVESATPDQRAAAAVIGRLSGFLPLYVTMVGRLVYEFGSEQPWETEVVEMLQEDRSSVFGGADDNGASFGSRIVGSSLDQVTDPDARSVFAAMAVAAEDVPMPMPALELVWCAKMGIEPPIGRFGMMKLRKHVFQLLDRNLVLGETTTGVYMHDVVRDYCIHSVAAVERRRQHRTMVKLVYEATPPGGWPDATDEPLPTFVQQSLRHLMASSIAAAGDVDAEVLGWLAEAKSLSVTQDLFRRCAANAITAPVLIEHAERIERRGEAGSKRTAGLLFVCASITEEFAGASFISGDAAEQPRAARGRELAARGAALMAEEGETPERRLEEVDVQLHLLSVTPVAAHGAIYVRVAALVELGIAAPPHEQGQAVSREGVWHDSSTASWNDSAGGRRPPERSFVPKGRPRSDQGNVAQAGGGGVVSRRRPAKSCGVAGR